MTMVSLEFEGREGKDVNLLKMQVQRADAL